MKGLNEKHFVWKLQRKQFSWKQQHFYVFFIFTHLHNKKHPWLPQFIWCSQHGNGPPRRFGLRFRRSRANALKMVLHLFTSHSARAQSWESKHDSQSCWMGVSIPHTSSPLLKSDDEFLYCQPGESASSHWPDKEESTYYDRLSSRLLVLLWIWWGVGSFNTRLFKSPWKYSRNVSRNCCFLLIPDGHETENWGSFHWDFHGCVCNILFNHRSAPQGWWFFNSRGFKHRSLHLSIFQSFCYKLIRNHPPTVALKFKSHEKKRSMQTTGDKVNKSLK